MKLLMTILFLASIPSASAYSGIFNVLNEPYINSIEELPYSVGTPDIQTQTSGNIEGYIDIVGFRNLSKRNGTLYVNDAPDKLAIVASDAYNIGSGVVDSLEKTVSYTYSGQDIIASLNVVMTWHKMCRDKRGSYRCKSATETATFQDTELAPTILNSADDIRVIFREQNFTYINTSALEINVNDSIYDRYLFKNDYGYYEKINRLWHVEQTDKGIYFANESVINQFHANNISHSLNLISVPDIPYSVVATGLYSTTDKVNVTRVYEESDPTKQFTNPSLWVFLSVLSLCFGFVVIIKRRL